VPGIEPGPGGANAPVFREFVVQLPVDAVAVVDHAARHGVLAGWPAARGWAPLGTGALLVAATEQRTDEDIEQLATVLEHAIVAVGKGVR
jgi:glycine cleavage system pyridoxal-binding protein P